MRLGVTTYPGWPDPSNDTSAKKTNKDRDWALFWKLYKKSQSDLKIAYWDYLNTILTEDNNNKGLQVWRSLKGMRKDSCGVSTLASGDRVRTTPRNRAEMLNTQFSSVFTRENRWNVSPAKPSPFPRMPSIRVASAGISKLLGHLNQKKACGNDNIPAAFLKHCAEELSPMLAFIIHQSLDNKTVPDDWKRALVTPIFKKGARSKCENYRPVLLTATCCRVAEHIIVSQTMGHLDVHNILVNCQHGFRRKRSCETQLLITTHDFAAILNRHSQADVAVLDFVKAFDKVPHHGLLSNLKYYNLDNNVVGLVLSFLTGHTQRVVVDACTSSEAAALSGVPQGTVRGPLLFLVFINDIIQESSSSIGLFVDDCLMHHEIRSKSDCSALQSDLDNLIQWSKTWGMEYKISKCNILSVTNASRNKIKHQYTMDGQALKTQDSTEYLGITINSKLHWINTSITSVAPLTRLTLENNAQMPARPQIQGLHNFGAPQDWVLLLSLGPSPPEVHQSTGHGTTASCPICQEHPIQTQRKTLPLWQPWSRT